VPNTPLVRLLRSVQFDEDFRHEARFDALEAAVGPDTKLGASLPTRAPKLRDWTIRAETPEIARTWLAKATLTSLTVNGARELGALARVLYTLPACANLESLRLVQSGPAPVSLIVEGAPASLTSLHFGHPSVDCTFTRSNKGWNAEANLSPWGRTSDLAPIFASEAFTHVKQLQVRAREQFHAEVRALTARLSGKVSLKKG
jgi:hypothetical protein